MNATQKKANRLHREDTAHEADRSQAVRTSFGTLQTLVLIAAVLVAGILIGRMLPGIPSAIAADPTAEATATREAELAELNDLRTKVAQPVVCTPAPTSTPTLTPTLEPTATTVPAQPAGAEVIDSEGWGVTILSIQPVPAPDGVDVSGQLMRVNLKLTNTTDEPMLPPFNDWRLIGATGERYSINNEATNAIVGPLWGAGIGAHKSETTAVVFDVASDAGDRFVLESEDDPLFRIELVIESRG